MADGLCVQINVTYEAKDKIKCEEDKTSKKDVHVFKGLLNGTIPIALKRYQVRDDKIWKEFDRDLKVLSSPENTHVNFIRYFGSYPNSDEGDNNNPNRDFKYILMEWCECSVADIIDPARKEKGKEKTGYFDAIVASFSQKEILRQSSEAVEFLHSLDKVHRNLHPENFLIFCVDPTKNFFIIKLTDFQFSKNFQTPTPNTGESRKDGWVAQESFKKQEHVTNKLDAFLLGCFYYYVLNEGKHPFGDEIADQINNILNEDDWVYQPDWDGKRVKSIKDYTPIHLQGEAEWALAMIKDLIKFEPGERKSVAEILESKYFLPESYKIYENPTSPKPGLCVIVTQEKHYNPVDDLDYNLDYRATIEPHMGVSLDADELEKIFVKLGYDILRLKNLRATELKTLLTPESLVKMEGVFPFSEYASLVICYLGHGDKGSVCGIDGKPVLLNDIQYAFGDHRCSSLSGKPKIFIILACQGNKEQNILARHAATSSLATLAGFSDVSYENRPILYDFIRLSSTIEEYVSYTYFGHGSVFIKSICSALANEYKDVNPPRSKERHKKDLTQLFTTVVTPSVGLYTGEIKQTPEFRSSLSKMILFRSTDPPGNLLKEGYYDGEKVDPKIFEMNRKKMENVGHKKKKHISNKDYEYLLRTILAEAPGEVKEVQQAIAWVILNRYNLNKVDWGGNSSLEAVCKFKQNWDSSTETTAKWIPYDIYDSNKDPTFGATYFKVIGGNEDEQMTIPENCRKTIKIGKYQFFKDPPQYPFWSYINSCNIV